jgi:hypothetical protein
VPFTEPSQETYAIFGRLTVAFGRLEGTVDWLMALLIMHTDRERSVSPDIWRARLSSKLADLKASARSAGLPSDLRDLIVGFAGQVKELSVERRRVVHALLMHEFPDRPEAAVSFFRTGRSGGASVDEVPLTELVSLAARIGTAAEYGLALTNAVADGPPDGGGIPEVTTVERSTG